jgi:chromosome segregation ATPase
MAEDDFPREEQGAGRSASSSRTLLIVLVVIFALYVLVSAYFLNDMHGNIAALQKTTADQAAAQDKLRAELKEMDSRNRAANEALADKVGMTQKELDQRAADLQRQQKASEARLAKQQQEGIQNVTGQVQNVASDVTATKTDLSATKTDLAETKAKLERTIGDLGLQSGLIARTREDLEELRKKGDRNYFEFTLLKGKKPTPVSTISLELKKVDPKKNKYTMDVLADDKKIEKKDKNLGEPVQFYTGRDRKLYELVIFEMAKNKVSGYLSTPKQ